VETADPAGAPSVPLHAVREEKRRRLEAKGWKVRPGTAREALRRSTEEAAYIDLKG